MQEVKEPGKRLDLQRADLVSNDLERQAKQTCPLPAFRHFGDEAGTDRNYEG